MKTFKTSLAAGLFLALVAGCSTDREYVLSTAGFRMAPADTPERQAQFNSLPADKITTVQRDGVTYYTLPDPKKDVLYVGRKQEYTEYQRLCLQNQIAQEQLAAQMNQAAAWNAWGPWDGPGWASTDKLHP
ncbi:MAG TPA: hypothetical protein VKV04_17130 [Verrucomicrobiae bacterium]|nr:hypothetical protein [Verrucomicrobiae bacterium]